VEVLAEVRNISLNVCEEEAGTGNIPPVARDDGSSERTPIDIGQPKNLDVMDNDYDPDNGPVSPIYLTGSPTTDRVGSSVSINGDQLYYDPGTLSYGEHDQIHYTISDGEDTDSATAYIRMVNKTAPITFTHTNLEGATYQPKWKGEYLDQVTGEHTFNVELATTPYVFEIKKEDVQISGGYENVLKEDDWIFKDVDEDKTGNKNSAELGLTYTDTSGNQAPDADIGLVSFDSGCSGGAPCTLQLSNDSSDPDGDPLTFSWDFGNGDTSTAENPAPVTYSSDGIYKIELIADDGALNNTDTCQVTLGSGAPGGYSSDCGGITLGGNENPNARFTARALNTEGSEHDYEFDAGGSSDPDGSISSYEWQVTDIQQSGGGTVVPIYYIDPSGEVVNGSFGNPRDDTVITYTIELTVTDNDGATDSVTETVSVTCNNTSGFGEVCITESTDGDGSLDGGGGDGGGTDGGGGGGGGELDDGGTTLEPVTEID
ncbi:MAG: PKD domain-containing protein, partial [Actinobacteria bacterium]|nr:PKD domain-containing protein [Actinomycetota bacterium]